MSLGGFLYEHFKCVVGYVNHWSCTFTLHSLLGVKGWGRWGVGNLAHKSPVEWNIVCVCAWLRDCAQMDRQRVRGRKKRNQMKLRILNSLLSISLCWLYGHQCVHGWRVKGRLKGREGYKRERMERNLWLLERNGWNSSDVSRRRPGRYAETGFLSHR